MTLHPTTRGSYADPTTLTLTPPPRPLTDPPKLSTATPKPSRFQSFKLNHMPSTKAIVGTVAVVSLAVFIGYTVLNDADGRIKFKDSVESHFGQYLKLLQSNVETERTHSEQFRSLHGLCFGREVITTKYDFSPILGLSGQSLKDSIQNHFALINDQIANAYTVSYDLFAKNRANQTNFELVLKGC